MTPSLVLAVLVLVAGCRLARVGEPDDGKGSAPRDADVIRAEAPATFRWTARFPTGVPLAQARQGCYGNVGYFYRLPTIDEARTDRDALVRALAGQPFATVWTASRASTNPADPGYPQIKVFAYRDDAEGVVLEVNPGAVQHGAVCLCGRENAPRNCHVDPKQPELGSVFPK